MKKIKLSPEITDLNIIGKAIKAARKEHKISQNMLQKKLELKAVYVCRGSISRIENGSRAVTDIEIKAIAEALEVSPNDLFDWNKV